MEAVFVRAGSQDQPDVARRRRWVLVTVLSLMAAMIATQLLLIVNLRMANDGQDLGLWQTLVGIFARMIDKHGSLGYLPLVVMFVIAPGMLVVERRMRFGDRLVIDDQGVRFQAVRFPGPLQRLWPSWRVDWPGLVSVERELLLPGSANGAWHLHLVTRDGARRRIVLDAWEAQGRPPAARPELRFRLRGPDRAEHEARADAHPLHRALVDHGFTPGPLDVAALPVWQRPIGGTELFDLAKNRHAVAVLALSAVGGGYFVLEQVVDAYRYLGSAPWTSLILFGALPVVPTGVLLRRHGVPVADSIALALLLGIGTVAAAHPASLRLAPAPQPVVATLQADAGWVPVEPGFAPFRIPRGEWEYWNCFRTGERYSFLLAHGLSGNVIIDLRPVRAAINEFDVRWRADPRGACAKARESLVGNTEKDRP